MGLVTCPLCAVSVEAAEAEGHLRLELRYALFHCQLCLHRFHFHDDAHAHFRGPFAAHPREGLAIVEMRDGAKDARLLQLLERIGLADGRRPDGVGVPQGDHSAQPAKPTGPKEEAPRSSEGGGEGAAPFPTPIVDLDPAQPRLLQRPKPPPSPSEPRPSEELNKAFQLGRSEAEEAGAGSGSEEGAEEEEESEGNESQDTQPDDEEADQASWTEQPEAPQAPQAPALPTALPPKAQTLKRAKEEPAEEAFLAKRKRGRPRKGEEAQTAPLPARVTCRPCGKDFQKSYARDHAATKHLKKTFHHCLLCGQSSNMWSLGIMNQHIRKVHGTQPGRETLRSEQSADDDAALRRLERDLYL